MIKLNINEENKYIVATITDGNSNEEISTALTDLMQLTQKFNEKFSIITDLTNFSPDSMNEVALLNKVHKSLNEKLKIKSTFRVVGDSIKLIQQFGKMDKLTHVQGIKYVPTIEDAIKQIEVEGE